LAVAGQAHGPPAPADAQKRSGSERPNVSAEPVGTLVADDPSGAIRIEPRLIARRAGFSPETAQVRNLRSRTQGGCLVVSGQSLSGEGNHQSRPEPEYLLSWLPSAFGSSKLTFVKTRVGSEASTWSNANSFFGSLTGAPLSHA
jgi:hypothetical protein